MSTETRRPDPCHYDRGLQARVTKRHRQTCNDRTCDGCAPCTAPHCPICGRGHLDNTHPQNCSSCVHSMRDDLTSISDAHTGLAVQAYAGSNGLGRLLAASPIPGGDAQVLIGPAVHLPLLRTYRGYTTEDHHKDNPVSPKTGRPTDPVPPLAILADWEDRWRTWLDLAPASRATVGAVCRFLRDDVIPTVAQHDPADRGPDLVEMATQLRRMRDQLERALHDEREPDRGISCFECDGTLVRRYRRARRCTCGTRPVLQHTEHGRCDCLSGVRHDLDDKGQLLVTHLRHRVLDDAHIHDPADHSCIACHREAEWDAEHASHNQGGLTDPTVGMSWECPSCRKSYDPGEYQNAVRADLARKNGGWISIPVAAEGAQAVAGRPVTDKTIRSWVTRDWVKSEFQLNARGIPGPRLVLWNDVRREAERAGAGRNQCTHVTPAREWRATLETYPELEVFEEELDDCRESCDRCLELVAATLRQARRSGGRIGA